MASKMHAADIAANEQIGKERALCGKAEALTLILPFLAFLFVLLALFFIIPDRAYSKAENKVLSSFPSFEESFGDLSFEKLKESISDKDKDDPFKEYNGKISDYINDQFPFKEEFVALYAASNLAEGKLGSGGVIAGKDGYLLSEEGYLTAKERKKLASYASTIGKFSEYIPVTVAVAPTGIELMTDKLPGAISEKPGQERYDAIVEAFSGKGCTFIDLQKVFTEHRDEPIYYRTDHHWTTLGAYYGTSSILKSLGKTPAALEDFRRDVIFDDFKGTVYNRSGMFWHKGEEIEYFRYDGDDRYTVSYCRANGVPYETSSSLYNMECLRSDYIGTAYDSFVAPVSVPVVKIEKEGEDRQTMLVLKDSFAHSALSFLARDYDLITVDIRKNIDYAFRLVDNGEVDLVLVLVNADTLEGA